MFSSFSCAVEAESFVWFVEVESELLQEANRIAEKNTGRKCILMLNGFKVNIETQM